MKKEGLVTVSKYLSDKDENIKSFNYGIKNELDMIHSFERARALMYKDLENKSMDKLFYLRAYVTDEEYEKIKTTVDMIAMDGWSIEYENYRIKITFHDIPVRLYDKKISSSIEYLNKQLARNIITIINTLDPVPKMDKVLVWVKYYMPKKRFDIDNNCYKPIIDGISRSLIENDDMEHLMCGFTGNYSKENPHTEVYIYDQNYINTKEIFDQKEE